MNFLARVAEFLGQVGFDFGMHVLKILLNLKRAGFHLRQQLVEALQ